MTEKISSEEAALKVISTLMKELERRGYWDNVPLEMFGRYSLEKIQVRAFNELPNFLLYYICGVFPKKYLPVIALEMQTIMRANAWQYVETNINPNTLSVFTQPIWVKLKQLNEQPQRKLTDDFMVDDLERLRVPPAIVEGFFPQMSEVISSLLKKDFDRYIDLACYFDASIFKSVERFSRAIRLVAESMEYQSFSNSLLVTPGMASKEILSNPDEKRMHRLSTALNILTRFPKGHAALDDIYADVEKAVFHTYVHEARMIQNLHAPKAHAKRNELMDYLGGFFAFLGGDSVSVAELDREVSDVPLNLRYVLEQTVDEKGRDNVLSWFDEYVGLTEDEKSKYAAWEENRLAAGKPCFVPGDGMSADEKTPLLPNAEQEYRADLAAMWSYLGIKGIFDIDVSEMHAQAEKRVADAADFEKTVLDADTEMFNHRVTETVVSDLLKHLGGALGHSFSVHTVHLSSESENDSHSVESCHNLSSLEWRLGRMGPDITDLRLLYLMGVLTRQQFSHVCLEEEKMLFEKKYPEQMKFSELITWMRNSPFPIDLRANPDVVRTVEHLRNAMYLYYNRFYSGSEMISLSLGCDYLASKIGKIASLRENPIEMQGRFLEGLTVVLNGLGAKEENTNLHQMMDKLVREYYTDGVDRLKMLSQQMPLRQQSQMAVALPAFEKFQDTTAFFPNKTQVYSELIGGFRQLIAQKYGAGKKGTAALDEFNKWVGPVEEYWGLRVRHTGRPSSNDHSQDGLERH